MSRGASALALVLGSLALFFGGEACMLRAVHPGHLLVRRRCTSCHREPPRERIRSVGVDALAERHRRRVKLSLAEIEALRGYAENGDP